MSTAVATIDGRALYALGIDDLPTAIEKLKKLAEKSADITTITNQAGYGQVHRLQMDLKGERVTIEKRGKAARDETNAFNKTVISMEKALIGAFVDEEDRLAALKVEWDSARERERQAEIDAENARVARIQAALDDIRALPQEAMGKTAAHAMGILAEAEALTITEAEYQEATQTAQTALYMAITAIKGIVAERQSAEAEQDRIAKERAELAKFRAEADERERVASIKAAQELHAARQETERLQKAAREAQDAADRQTAELERQRREADEKRLAEDLRVQALQEAEQKRLDDQAAALKQQQEQYERSAHVLGAEVSAKLEDEFDASHENVTIPAWEYNLLVAECKLLNHLRAAGVEQWEGYSEP